MIYPDINLKEWLKKYPALDVVTRKCHYCGKPRIANIPYIEKEWVGLISLDCSCTRGLAFSYSMARPGTEAEAALISLF